MTRRSDDALYRVPPGCARIGWDHVVPGMEV
jgi:hypothetical protein